MAPLTFWLSVVLMYVLGERDFLFFHDNVMSSSIIRSTIYTALTTSLKNYWPGLSCGHEAHT